MDNEGTLQDPPIESQYSLRLKSGWVELLVPFENTRNKISNRVHGGICREFSAQLKSEALQVALVLETSGMSVGDGMTIAAPDEVVSFEKSM